MNYRQCWAGRPILVPVAPYPAAVAETIQGGRIKTHTRTVLFRPIQARPNPQSKPSQANPSPAKLIQKKCLVLLGFIRPNRDLSMGYSDFQIRIFSSPLRPVAKPRLARCAFDSDYQHNVGRILILTRDKSKNCVVSLSGFHLRPPLRPGPARSRRMAQNNTNAVRALSMSFRSRHRDGSRSSVRPCLTRAAGDRRSGGGRRRRRRAR